MLKISGSRAHAGTGKLVPYLAEIVLVGSTGKWGAHILLSDGNQHLLSGGTLTSVTAETIEEAATTDLHEEIDSLDIDELNRKFGKGHASAPPSARTTWGRKPATVE